MDHPHFTETFKKLTDDPRLLTIESDIMKEIEHFISLCFAKTTTLREVNVVRQKLLTVGLKTMENIPPSLHALIQHVKRACYVTCFQWRVCLIRSPTFVDPRHWGWQLNDRLKQFVLFWTRLMDISENCRLLLSCGCQYS